MTRSEHLRDFRQWMDANVPGWRGLFAAAATREMGPGWTHLGMRIELLTGERIEFTFLANPDRDPAGSPGPDAG